MKFLKVLLIIFKQRYFRCIRLLKLLLKNPLAYNVFAVWSAYLLGCKKLRAFETSPWTFNKSWVNQPPSLENPIAIIWWTDWFIFGSGWYFWASTGGKTLRLTFVWVEFCWVGTFVWLEMEARWDAPEDPEDPDAFEVEDWFITPAWGVWIGIFCW